MDVIEGFAGQFGEELPALNCPSRVTMALWTRVADTYSVASLSVLWAFEDEALRAFEAAQGHHLPSVQHAVMVAIARSLRFAAWAPDPAKTPIVAKLYDGMADESTTWLTVQLAIERVMIAWQVLGL